MLVRGGLALLRGEPDKYPYEHIGGALSEVSSLFLALSFLVPPRRPKIQWMLITASFCGLSMLYGLKWFGR